MNPAIIIESRSMDKTEWIVSFCGSNPEEHDAVVCASEHEARKLISKLNG